MCRTYLPLRLHPRLGADGLDIRLNAITVGRVTVGYLHFGTGMHIITEEAINYHLAIPLAGRSRSRAGTRDAVYTAPGFAAVFMPTAPADLTWTNNTEQQWLMLDAEDVRAEMTRLLGHSLRKPLTFAEKMDIRGPAGQAIVQTLRLIDNEAQRDQGLLHHRLCARNLGQILIDGLILGQPHNYSEELATEQSSPARRATKQAIGLLQGRPEYPWSSSELAAQVSVSPRTLQSGFHDITGLAPMEYLRAVRLRHAHDDLADADPHGTTVGLVAHRWGFVHLGRFAVTYQHRYGESPSQTLRRG
jgi:AraC-like DNA-binding protein